MRSRGIRPRCSARARGTRRGRSLETRPRRSGRRSSAASPPCRGGTDSKLTHATVMVDGPRAGSSGRTTEDLHIARRRGSEHRSSRPWEAGGVDIPPSGTVRRLRSAYRRGIALLVVAAGAACGDSAPTSPVAIDVTDRCLVRLHGKGGTGAEPFTDGGVAVLAPTGNANGWGARQWLYFPDERVRRCTARVADAVEPCARASSSTGSPMAPRSPPSCTAEARRSAVGWSAWSSTIR